jgi:hypothetical protein
MTSTNTRKFRALFGIALLAAAAMATASRPASAEDEAEAHGLTGTWLTTIQLFDCSSGAVAGRPFQSLLTFGAGGTLIETTANAAFAPGQRGPGHGTWERTNHNVFRGVSEAFILFTTPAHGPVPEFDAGRQRIEQYIEYSGGNQFTSEATITFSDTSGTVLRSGCAHAVAMRQEG